MNTNIESNGTNAVKNANAIRTENDLMQMALKKQIARQIMALNPVKVSKVEQLPEEVRDCVMDWAQEDGVDKVRKKLATQGYIVARATLARYLRRQRQAEAAELREERESAAKDLVARGEGATFRAGAMEALRGRIFDRAQSGGNAEESLRLYQALTAEEEKLKKLELHEKELEFKRERMQLEAARGGAKLFLEALKILNDEKMTSDARVLAVRERLEGWQRGAIDVEAKRIGEGDAATAPRVG